jgi:hypothetical protein
LFIHACSKGTSFTVVEEGVADLQYLKGTMSHGLQIVKSHSTAIVFPIQMQTGQVAQTLGDQHLAIVFILATI